MQLLSDVHAALLQRGFVPAGKWIKGLPRYAGQLNTSHGGIGVFLIVVGLDKPPLIKLAKVPKTLQPFAPHIGPNGFLCYSASGFLAMDIFNAASQMLACIDKAESVLSDVLDNKMVHDLANEFFVYWGRSESVYLDTKNFANQYITAALITKRNETNVDSIVLTDDLGRSSLKLNLMGFDVTDLSCGACIVNTESEPYPLSYEGRWPPKTLKELIIWQRALDSECAKKIVRRMMSLFNKGQIAVLLLISSPTIKYSAIVRFTDFPRKLQSRSHAMNILGSSKLTPIDTVRMDDAYIAERNQPAKKNLLGLKILMIGCGAIGGYLADLLVRNGAGLGDGHLILLDTDVLKEGNIGRHRLGFESLNKPKAEALASQIILSFPTANIVGRNINAKEFDLFSLDLIINATGEQALGDWLSQQLNQNDFIPIVHTWIEGSGVVARSFIQENITGACYRCLVDRERKPIYPPTTEPYVTELAGQGCESLFVTFPATAAVFAAALAAQHVSDWINGEASPNLRTVLLDRNYQLSNYQNDPLKQSDCPACHIIKNG